MNGLFAQTGLGLGLNWTAKLLHSNGHGLYLGTYLSFNNIPLHNRYSVDCRRSPNGIMVTARNLLTLRLCTVHAVLCGGSGRRLAKALAGTGGLGQ